MRALQVAGRRVERAAQRAQEGLELLALGGREAKRLELAVPERSRRRAVVVRDHVRQRGELAGVHVRRAARDVAQRRRLVGTHQLLALGDGEAELLAVVGAGVAVAARAAELPRQRLPDAGGAPAVRRQRRRGERHAGVVEVVVRQQRPVVAVDAARLADEQPQPGLLVAREGAFGRVRPARQLGVHVAVEARRREADAPLVRGDRLAEVRVDARDLLAGSGPNTASYSRRYSAATSCAYCVRSPPCSTALSRGPSACPHWLSARPSQNCQAPYAVPATGIVRRAAVPTPTPRGRPSWKSWLGTWQLAQETSPVALSRVSKKSRCPSRAAALSSA